MRGPHVVQRTASRQSTTTGCRITAFGGYVDGAGSSPAFVAGNSGVKVEVINHGPPVQTHASAERQPDGSQLLRLVLGAVREDIATGGQAGCDQGPPGRAGSGLGPQTVITLLLCVAIGDSRHLEMLATVDSDVLARYPIGID